MAEPQPFSMYSTPSTAAPCGKTLLLLGEAPGEEEARAGKPFVGPSGKLTDQLLEMAGLSRSHFHVTNVFATRPPSNDLKAWTLTKTDLKRAGHSEAGRLPKHGNRYLLPEKEPELQRLGAELQAIKPDLIIALGGTALWALLGDSRITQHRGTFFHPRLIGAGEPQAEALARCTALATFHPAMVLRAWENRPIVWADLLKAKRWLQGTLQPPVKRRLWINPTEAEIAHVYRTFTGLPTKLLGIDIETQPRLGQITTFAIGSSSECLCIPVWNPQSLPHLSNCYADAPTEASAWAWIRKFCELPNPKVMQNGLYDMSYLLDVMDIRPRNVLHDTAILQHALQPELPKDLGTLGSLFLNEHSWKSMRVSTKEVKADE